MTDDFFTTVEAGAGSYPEPPYRADASPVRECEECGDADDLFEVDGHIFCRWCKAGYIFEHSDLDDFQRYVSDNYRIQKEFYVEFFLKNADEFALLCAAKYAFMLLPSEVQQTEIQAFVEGQKPEFAEFMEVHHGEF